MKKILNILPVFVLIGCQLITEPDISNETVTLRSPVDSLVTTTTTQTLWWNHVENAERYNIQIVGPSWEAVEILIADSNVSDNKFVVTLSPGEYDWGVMAYNHSSSTPYTVNHLTVDTASTLNNQRVVLKAPKSGFSTSEEKIEFSWFSLDLADNYILAIRQDSWEGNDVIQQRSTSYDTISEVLDEGVFYWGIKATNDFSQTQFTYQALYVDRTAPGKPNITIPKEEGDTVLIDEFITWERTGESVSPVSDNLQIAADSAFTNIEVDETITTTEWKVVGLSDGYYYCRVRSSDAAGNTGELSSAKKFYVE